MSDNRNPNDPSWRDPSYDTHARTRNAATGWIAGGVFLVILIGLAFGVGHMPNHDNNDAANISAPGSQPAPSGPMSPSYAPAPVNPGMNPAPMTPAPNTAPSTPQP